MVKAARSMPSDIAEKLDYIKELRFKVIAKVNSHYMIFPQSDLNYTFD